MSRLVSTANIVKPTWDPTQQVGLLYMIDYHIAANVTPNTDGAAIVSATDPIGGATMSRFAATFEATYQLAILNSKNVARYDGGVRGQRTGAAALSHGPFTRIFVVKANTPGLSTFIGAYDGGNTGFMNVGAAPSIRVVGAGGTSDKNLTVSWLDNNAHTIFWWCDGTHAGHGFAIDNVDQVLTNGASTGDPGTAVTVIRPTLGCNTGIASAFKGDFGLDGIIDHSIKADTSARSNWQTYLKARFGTT